MVKLIRVARIAIPGAFRDSPAHARNFETIGATIINPIDLAEIVDVNPTNAMGNTKHDRIQGFGEFVPGFPKYVNRADFLKGVSDAVCLRLATSSLSANPCEIPHTRSGKTRFLRCESRKMAPQF